ncbi:DUF4041 domain-containing protein [Aquibacillus saliphilus]|uniref:DUF4041 domain-containing protein n=1 Tax=Aquibacillus saliphilus TaxID=1909422 RepID=UPI001CEFB482|nr:DUF4041 domain-containing protein [Aquibacillus saliphilus]
MKKFKWYLSVWFISIWFTLSILIIPFIIGVILLIFRIIEEKKLQRYWEESGFNEIVDVKEEKEKIQKETLKHKESIEKEISKLQEEAKKATKDMEKQVNNFEVTIEELQAEKQQKQEEIIVIDDELLYQSFGFYDPKYELENSEQYKEKLDEIRDKQKEMVKNKTATDHLDEWILEGSKQKGKVMNNNNIKLTLRSFNNECDAAISNVKFNNINAMEKRVKKAFDQLNKTNKNNRIEIKTEYLSLKIDELYLAFEYAQKKEEEKEEQRQIREQMREEKKVQQEIEKQRKKLEKDEEHHKQALEKYQDQLENASDEMKKDLEDKIKEVMERMEELNKEKESVDFREQNARAGYVYIISNIGSFGENIYKIGMTRRLEPNERVKELGDASVPFTYDIHGMIFSNDAPTLENTLHHEFNDKRMNLVNLRKEFFKVSLKEIEETVKAKHNKVVEFTKLAEAEDWRKSEQIRKKSEDKTEEVIA